MSDELHGDAGKELEHDGCPAIIDGAGEIRKLGAILAPGLQSSLPLFEDKHPLMTDAEIKTYIRNGKPKSGRHQFGDDWIADQGQHGSCLPPGSRVRMADGTYKPIEQVKLFDQVLTAEGNIGSVMTLFGKQHDGELVHVKLWGNNLLKLTEEHPVLTRRGYVKSGEVQVGDWVAIPKYMPQSERFIQTAEYVASRSYSKSKRQRSAGYSGRGGVDVAIATVPDVIELTPDVGYVFGLFLAEGNTDRQRVVWTFNVNEKDTLAADLQSKLSSCFGAESHVQVRANNTVKVVLYGVQWAKLFEGLFQTGALSKRLPAPVAGGPKEFLAEVLRGWLDGDGGQHRTVTVGVSISHDLALSMWDIANYLGMRPSLRWSKQPISHGVNYRHPRYEVTIGGGGEEATRGFQGRCEQDEKYVWRRVRGIDREDYTGRVYNFEVQGDNSYVAEGIGVHNCNGFASAKALQRARVRKGLTRVNLSGSAVYALVNGGRDSGSIPEEAMVAMQSKGAVPESNSNVNKIYLSQYSAADWAQAARYKAGECYSTRDRQAFLTGIAMGFDGVIALQAGSRFMRLNSDGIAGADSGPGNHANLIDDIDLIGDTLVLDDANSWGLSYGTRGRAYITWESHLAQPSRSFAFYLIRTAQDDPSAVNPPVIQ